MRTREDGLQGRPALGTLCGFDLQRYVSLPISGQTSTEKDARAPAAGANETTSVVIILDAHYLESARVARDPDDPLFDEEQWWFYDEI